MTVPDPPHPEPEPSTREDRLLGGRVRLVQSADGYRAGMDAALLAAAAHPQPGQRLVEAGCGPGGALLQIAARCPGALLTGIERDSVAADLARGNLALNGIEDRTAIVQADIDRGFAALGLEPFDWAVANPPFFDDPSTLRPPAPQRREAWMADGGLQSWTGFLLKAVCEGGRIVLIHRADRLADLLAQLAPKAGSFQVRPIHPFADAPAKRVVVTAVKTGKAPLRLLPALVLHDRSGGKHTPEAEAILRGRADLASGDA